MWWEPRDESEVEVNAVLKRISGDFLEGHRDLKAVHSIGSTFGWPDNRRVPFLIIDESYSSKVRRIGWIFDAILSVPPDRESVRSSLTSLRDAASDLKQMLSRWELPDETKIMFSAVPRATSSEPCWPIEYEAAYASVGLMLMVEQGGGRPRVVFLTAGHLSGAVPYPVSTSRRKWLFFREAKRVGSVQYAIDAIGASRVDVAVMVPENVREVGSWPELPVCICPALAGSRDFVDLAPVDVYGGKSGKRGGWLNGAMLHSRSFDGRIWDNCWVINENDYGVVQPGDSGSVAVLNDPYSGQSVLGQVVASFGTVRRNGLYPCGLVQDAALLLAHLKANYNAHAHLADMTDHRWNGIVALAQKFEA